MWMPLLINVTKLFNFGMGSWKRIEGDGCKT